MEHLTWARLWCGGRGVGETRSHCVGRQGGGKMESSQQPRQMLTAGFLVLGMEKRL